MSDLNSPTSAKSNTTRPGDSQLSNRSVSCFRHAVTSSRGVAPRHHNTKIGAWDSSSNP